jgi:serine phosphatase RsbU (regulator of sigma subunit)
LASTDYVLVVQKLEALGGLATDLFSVERDDELRARLTAGLGRLFPGVRRVAVLTASPSGDDLLAGEAAALALVDTLCRRIDAIPLSQRADSREVLLPYLIVPQLIASDPEVGLGSIVSAPIVHGTRLLGLLVVESAPDAPAFTIADQHALVAVASQALLVMQRLAVRSPDERRLRDLAREIQRRFLPALSPEMGGFRITAEYRPAHDVGGDFYDLVQSPGGELTAVIGDVSGKGVPAALLMSRISSDFRRLAATASSPQSLLAQLNHAMAEHAPDDAFATAVCLRLDARGRRMRIANAGHLAPLLRRMGGQVLAVGPTSGLPLGMLPAQSYPEQEVPLSPGDLVILMTDGVVEALDHEVDRMGVDRLRAIISAAPHDGAEIQQRLLAEVGRQLEKSRSRRLDDLTLLALELPCAGERAPREAAELPVGEA